MTKIALIGCTSRKLNKRCRAEELYSASHYFRLRLEYAKLLKIPFIYILSAKYGLIPLDKVIEPYDLCLKDMGKKYRKKWSFYCLNQLKRKHDLSNDIFYLLCGKEYREYLEKNLINSINPLPKRCGIGCQLKFYKNEIERLKRI